MSRLLTETLFFLTVLTGCTVNQENRIHEVLSAPTGSFNRVKDIQFVAERSSTDNFSLSIEQGSLSTQKGIYPVYIVKGSQLPLNERFIFARIDRTTGKIDPQCEFTALEDGQLVIYNRDGISYEREIPFIETEGLKAGYPVDYAIVSKKTYASATAEFIRYPLLCQGENGERIEAVVTHPLGTHFLLRADGFLPFEPLTLVHTSGSTTEEMEVAADENGAFGTSLHPLILGHLGGEARLSVRRQADGPGLTLNYPWGTALERKTWKERTLMPMLLIANREIDEEYPAGLAALLE